MRGCVGDRLCLHIFGERLSARTGIRGEEDKRVKLVKGRVYALFSLELKGLV